MQKNTAAENDTGFLTIMELVLTIVKLEEKVRSLERENHSVIREFSLLLVAYKKLLDESKDKDDDVQLPEKTEHLIDQSKREDNSIL